MTSYVNAFHKFLSTPSARWATFAWARAAKKRERFLSTPSARRATSGRCPRLRQDRYFYPRPPRGGRHASRRHRQHRANFDPRPPRGGRLCVCHLLILLCIFLSTPSARRATSESARAASALIFLSTPSARRATYTSASHWRDIDISIHALREEGDLLSMGIVPGMCLFLSTPSARRATDLPAHLKGHGVISIHALREEGDYAPPWVHLGRNYFYPRPPRGGRQQKQRQNLYFQTNYTTFCTNLEEP